MTAKFEFVNERFEAAESEMGGFETYGARRGSPHGFHLGQLAFLAQTVRA